MPLVALVTERGLKFFELDVGNCRNVIDAMRKLHETQPQSDTLQLTMTHNETGQVIHVLVKDIWINYLDYY